MDTKFIDQYGTDMRCYRIRTARQRKRMQYKDFDKQLLRLHNEMNSLYTQIRNLGWEPLVPPVQKGWKRSFVLRRDVAFSRHADFFENILQKINTSAWSHRKDFRVRKRRYGKKYYIVKPQFLRKLYEYELPKLGLSVKELQYFDEVWETNGRREPVKRYVFSQPWRFVLRVSPNIIDKVKKRDELLEARLQEIKTWFERNGYQYRMDRLRDIGYRNWRDRETGTDRNTLRNKPLRQNNYGCTPSIQRLP